MNTRSSSIFSAIGGFFLGASIVWLTDPRSGARRRAVVRDKLIHYSRVSWNEGGKIAKDLSNRMQGRIAELRQARHRNESVSDDVLVSRVRSAIGRPVSHPHLVEVQCQDGRVTLTGIVLKDELNDVIDVVESVPGVHGVENHLDTCDTEKEIQRAAGRRGARKAA